MTPAPRKSVRQDTHWLDAPEWWKKWKPLRWLAIGVMVAGAGSGLWTGTRLVTTPSEHPATAQYLALEKQRVQIIGGFSSYDGVDAVTAKLSAAGYPWSVKKNHRIPSAKFPPRDLDTVTVENYQHLGNAGSLTLEFFNNRLYEAEFVPRDAAAYAAALHRMEPRLKPDRVGKVEFQSGNLRIASNVDLAKSTVGQSLHTKPYAIWQDLRLIRQRDEWDAAYSSIPYKVQN